MASRKDIEKQIAALSAELENADSDDEVWIKEGDREFKVTGNRASKILGRWADLWADEPAKGPGEEEEGEEEPETPKPGANNFFGKRKA